MGLPEASPGGADLKAAARRMCDELVASDFAIDPGSTLLLLNSLVTAWHSRRRIYLNAFQRSREVLHHFGHRLHRLEFNVHSLDPWSIIAYPQVQDVIVTLSGSLETEPVLVTLLHADREGLYRFVITGQPADETRKRFQGVLPVHIPGVTSAGLAPRPELGTLLPLGTLFELRAFLFLEAMVEVMADVMEAAGVEPGAIATAAPPARSDPMPSPQMLAMCRAAREQCGRVPEVMRALVAQYRSAVEAIDDAAIDRFLALVEETARAGKAVYITGYGRSNEIGGLFAHRLANLGVVVAMTPTRIERRGEAGDLLFALSGFGNTYEVLQRMNGARRGGLRTAVLTAVADSPVTHFSDVSLVVPAAVEPRYSTRLAEQPAKAPPAPRPTASTFGLNALLTLEAAVSVLIGRLGRGEADLQHTDPWQGF